MSTMTLTLQDVTDVSNELIDENGSTTTLDVKRELRIRGFWATQDDVRFDGQCCCK